MWILFSLNGRAQDVWRGRLAVPVLSERYTIINFYSISIVMRYSIAHRHSTGEYIRGSSWFYDFGEESSWINSNRSHFPIAASAPTVTHHWRSGRAAFVAVGQVSYQNSPKSKVPLLSAILRQLSRCQLPIEEVVIGHGQHPLNQLSADPF